jgi:hypothetical protein
MLLFDTEVFSMTLSKRLRRLWTLLTTEEIFDEHGSLGAAAWCAGRLAPRARKARRHSGPGPFSGFRPFSHAGVLYVRRFPLPWPLPA